MVTSLSLIFLWGSHTHEMKFIFLLLICLMTISLLDQLKNLEGKREKVCTLICQDSVYLRTSTSFQYHCYCLRLNGHFLSPDLGKSFLSGILSSVFTSPFQFFRYSEKAIFLNDFVMLLFIIVQWNNVVLKIETNIQQDLALVSSLTPGLYTQ